MGPDVDVQQVLATVEHRNLDRYGYGIKAFTLSMLEAAIEATDGAIGTDELAQILAAGRSMLDHPVDLIDGVAETVAALAEAGYRLVVVTKGDLHHQQAKLWRSGLVDHFERVEIVAEKDPDTYRRVVASMAVAHAGLDTPWQRFPLGSLALPSQVGAVDAIVGDDGKVLVALALQTDVVTLYEVELDGTVTTLFEDQVGVDVCPALRPSWSTTAWKTSTL